MKTSRHEKLLREFGFVRLDLTTEEIQNAKEKMLTEFPEMSRDLAREPEEAFFWDMGGTTVAVDETGSSWKVSGSVDLTPFGFRDSSAKLNEITKLYEQIKKEPPN